MHAVILNFKVHQTPEGRRKRDRFKNTWRRTTETEIIRNERKLAKDRQRWKTFVSALQWA